MNPDEPPAPPRDHDAAGRELLHDPKIRELLGDVLVEELEARRAPSAWKRLQPWLAGSASALVTMLAFFLPSLQDQWDRFESRRVVQRYVELGRDFMREGRYRLAEETFAKAFELSENRRLDIEERRLAARVERVNADPEWGKRNPRDVAESDILYLIQLQKGRGRERAASYNSYGVFLAGALRRPEAEAAFREAIRLDPASATAWINLGNLLSDEARLPEAEAAYRRASALDSTIASGPYNLGLLLAQTGRGAEAEAALRRAVSLDPGDTDVLRQLAEQLEANGKRPEAAEVRARLAKLGPPPRPRDVPPGPGADPE